MCCTIGDVEAKLTGTKLYAGEATYQGKYVHVLAYQNTAETKGNEPNAMIIPFPTNKPMGPENILDTSGYKNFLDDIAEATAIRSRGLNDDDDFLSFGVAAGVAEVFSVGAYTVVLATHVSQVPEALKRVPEHSRPTVSTKFLINYGRLYPGQPVALCCWSGLVEAAPLLWWYEPSNTNDLFIPTMDAHDGNPPDLNAMVHTDHIISVGSNIKPSGSKVYYSQELGEAASLLPSMVYGTRLNPFIKNGDSFVNTSMLRHSNQILMRRGSIMNAFDSMSPMTGWHA